MHDLEFGFTPGVHAALVCILYLMTCFLLAPMTRYSTCLHALCSLPFWALSCYNTGKIPYLFKSACKAAKLHGNILPDSRTLQRCGLVGRPLWRRGRRSSRPFLLWGAGGSQAWAEISPRHLHNVVSRKLFKSVIRNIYLRISLALRS